MTSYEDLLVGSGTPTSLKGMPGVEFVTTDNSDPWAGFLVEAPLRGQNKVLPGTPGEVGADLVADAFDFSIGPFVIKGATRPEFLSRLAAVRALFVAVNVTLTRRMETLAVDPFYEDDSCNGQYRGLTVTGTPSPTEADVVLALRNLDGGWS